MNGGGTSLSVQKLILLLLALAWLGLGRRALPAAHEWRALLPTLALLLVALVSARLGPEEYVDEGLRFDVRLLAVGFAYLVALRVGTSSRKTDGLLWAVALGGGASALLGLGEALRVPALEPVLALFKVAPTRVAGELRVSASFQYATIAAMYFEMVACLAIGLAAAANGRRQRALGAAIAVLCTADVVLSLTRAGMLTLAIAFAAFLLAAAVRADLKRLVAPSVLSAAILVGGVALLLARNPVFDLRLVSESDADWYGAAYAAPASLTAQSEQPARVELDVRNEGRITWTRSGTHPFALGYRWLTEDGEGVLDVSPAEVPLTHDVEPGESIHLAAIVTVPPLPAGSYRLDWGMLQRDVLQFYERGWADAETQVSVTGTGASVPPPAVLPRDDGEAPWVVGRLELWGAAARLIAAHPLLGVGPDNFRHFYGAELGLEGWDERVQANNLYLELLADLGVLGLAAFLWVVASSLVPLIRALRAGATAQNTRWCVIALGVLLAIGAFLVHGLLDAFLAFTPTAMLFWMLLGLAQAQKPQVSGR